MHISDNIWENIKSYRNEIYEEADRNNLTKYKTKSENLINVRSKQWNWFRNVVLDE